jgi:hypothetical protein
MSNVPKMEPVNQDCVSLAAWPHFAAIFQRGTTHKYDSNGATHLGTYLMSPYR